MVLFIAEVAGEGRRIVAAWHEAHAAELILERYGVFPSAIDVAPFYRGAL